MNFNIYYKREFFSTIWDGLDALTEDERLIASEFVLEEIKRGNDALVKWANEHKSIFKRTNREQIEIVKEIMSTHGSLVKHNSEENQADPFVIALAIEGKRKYEDQMFPTEEFVVITDETYRPERIKIPNVCQHYGIECIDRFGFFDEMGWSW